MPRPSLLLPHLDSRGILVPGSSRMIPASLSLSRTGDCGRPVHPTEGNTQGRGETPRPWFLFSDAAPGPCEHRCPARQSKERGPGGNLWFPTVLLPSGQKNCRNHFCRGVYVAKIPRPQPPGAASPVRRLVVGDSQGGACSPLKARRAIRYAPPSRHSLRGPPRRGCPRPGHGASPPDSHSHARYTARS